MHDLLTTVDLQWICRPQARALWSRLTEANALISWFHISAKFLVVDSCHAWNGITSCRMMCNIWPWTCNGKCMILVHIAAYHSEWIKSISPEPGTRIVLLPEMGIFSFNHILYTSMKTLVLIISNPSNLSLFFHDVYRYAPNKTLPEFEWGLQEKTTCCSLPATLIHRDFSPAIHEPIASCLEDLANIWKPHTAQSAYMCSLFGNAGRVRSIMLFHLFEGMVPLTCAQVLPCVCLQQPALNYRWLKEVSFCKTAHQF